MMMQMYPSARDAQSKSPRNIAKTSILSFQELLLSDQLTKEKKTILELIRTNSPTTSRQLAKLSGMERTSVCRCLHDLQKETVPMIIVAGVEPCPISGRYVLNPLYFEQGKLFV